MRIIKIKANFFYNVERLTALQEAASLEQNLEFLVAAWLRDTGLWGGKFVVEVEPVKDEAAAITGIKIQAIVDIDAHPYLVEKLNGSNSQ